jgi:hypothetical protein
MLALDRTSTFEARRDGDQQAVGAAILTAADVVREAGPDQIYGLDIP